MLTTAAGQREVPFLIHSAVAGKPTHPVRESFFAPPAVAPPILVVSGEMDHVAAPAWGHEFCAELANCRFMGIPDLGHGPFDLDAWTGGACFDEIAAAFYGDSAAPDGSCLKGMRPPPFR